GVEKGDWAYVNHSSTRLDAIDVCKNYTVGGKTWFLPSSGIITSAIVSGDKKLMNEIKKWQDEENSFFGIGWVSDDIQPQHTEFNFVYSDIFEPQNPVKIVPYENIGEEYTMVICHSEQS
ncbi:hypothetical protein, partial [Vibrio campbellii]